MTQRINLADRAIKFAGLISLASGPVAIFMDPKSGWSTVVDAESEKGRQMIARQPHNLVGIYTRAVEQADLHADLVVHSEQILQGAA